jgi:bacillolysin
MSHWGVEKSWDFWTQIYSWQGINNNGAHLKVWADVRDMEGTVNNAEFMKDKNGTNLKFGRINGRLTSALDVCGHEYTHGVVSNTAKLTSNGISGALNESYSDIFGFMTERFIFPSTFDWQFGEDVDISIVRSFNNPSSIPFSLPPGIAPDFFPSTYPAMVGDANFYTGTGDDGGVHINCTVQNRCFNLLSVGGTQNSTLVTGIGIDNAALIAEYALMNFVKTHTNFPVNRMHWVNAAIFLFGRCSYEHFQTCRAWKAVNVGDICEPCALPIDCWDWRSGKRSIRISEFSNSLSKVNIYPNPTSSLLTLNLSELTLTKRADIISIKLLDINGREIKEIPFSIDEKVQILLNDVQNGIYVLKIESHNEVKTLRVLKI